MDEMKFEIEYTKLATYFNMLETVTDLAWIKIRKAQWFSQVVDPAHIEMCKIIMPKEDFMIYSGVNHERRIGVDVNHIAKFLNDNRVRIGQYYITVIITRDEFVIVGVENKFKRKFELVDLENLSEPKWPELKLPVECIVDVDDILTGIMMGKEICDYVTFRVGNESELIMLFTGDKDSHVHLLSTSVPEEYKGTISLFDLSYMRNIISALHKNAVKTTKIRLGNAYPVKIESELNNTQIMFLMAPRIDS